MNFFRINQGVPYLDAIAASWCRAAAVAGRSVSDGVLVVPSRRAARGIAASFLSVSGKPGLLLPKIFPLNALDETSLLFAMGLRLPKSVSPARRISMLASLILRAGEARGAQDSPSNSVGGALMLARDLAALTDEATRWGIDLASSVPGLVEGDLSAHWRQTVEFLSVAMSLMPDLLAAEGAVTPEQRRLALLEAQGSLWSDCPPDHPVWLIGLGYATPPLAQFALSVASLPSGRVYLAEIDGDLSLDVCNSVIASECHPYRGLIDVLSRCGATLEDVILDECADPPRLAARANVLRSAFLPPSHMRDWVGAAFPDGFDGIKVLQARDDHEDARAVALVVRDALATPGKTVAYVTDDRAQAARVSAELERVGLIAEDSAGELVSVTPPATFLRLLLSAVIADFDTPSLVALMAHPFFRFPGLSREKSRSIARRLEMKVVRKLHPAAGLSALLASVSSVGDEALLQAIRNMREAFTPLTADGPKQVSAALGALVKVADALSDRAVLWDGANGGAVGGALDGFAAASALLPKITFADLPDILTAAFADARIRRPRAHDAHARIAIWGLLEARLQSVDMLIIGGLVEGVFPGAADPGPWLSRPMRKSVGLPSPEDMVAERAHDFVSMMLSAREVVLCSPHRVGGAPAVPSRFLLRLEALAGGCGAEIPRHPAAAWSKIIEEPLVRIDRPRPEPKPPMDVRPKRYSVSDIGTLMADPYSVYAEKILGIAKVDRLSETEDRALFGTVAHNGIAAFLKEVPDYVGSDQEAEAAARLFQCFMEALPDGRPSPAIRSWWVARLRRLAEWFVSNETRRAKSFGAPDIRLIETAAEWDVGDGRTVTCRADRLEMRQGTLDIIDYKTGAVPSARSVERGDMPQLAIEGAMAKAGCFGPSIEPQGFRMGYWKLSGAMTPGEASILFGRAPEMADKVIERATSAVPALIAHFSSPDVAFLDTPHPARSLPRTTYSGVSRRAEWSANS